MATYIAGRNYPLNAELAEALSNERSRKTAALVVYLSATCPMGTRYEDLLTAAKRHGQTIGAAIQDCKSAAAAVSKLREDGGELCTS